MCPGGGGRHGPPGPLGLPPQCVMTPSHRDHMQAPTVSLGRPQHTPARPFPASGPRRLFPQPLISSQHRLDAPSRAQPVAPHFIFPSSLLNELPGPGAADPARRASRWCCLTSSRVPGPPEVLNVACWGGRAPPQPFGRPFPTHLPPGEGAPVILREIRAPTGLVPKVVAPKPTPRTVACAAAPGQVSVGAHSNHPGL